MKLEDALKWMDDNETIVGYISKYVMPRHPALHLLVVPQLSTPTLPVGCTLLPLGCCVVAIPCRLSSLAAARGSFRTT